MSLCSPAEKSLYREKFLSLYEKYGYSISIRKVLFWDIVKANLTRIIRFVKKRLLFR